MSGFFQPPICAKSRINGNDTTYYSQFPADTANGKRPYVKLKVDSIDVASSGDWDLAIKEQVSDYTH